MNSTMNTLVTGVAGFIGFHVAQALLARGHHVVGIDNLNPYYTPALKRARLDQILPHPDFRFIEMDISDRAGVEEHLTPLDITKIVHLAAQAGVRYSLEQPFSYIDANVTGHLCMLELARAKRVHHMVYASSSSIYGRNTKTPFNEDDITEQPASLYGATKKADELMASSYGHLYHIPLTGLRFFTVYGPWGRPDMAYWIFTEKMLKGEPIEIFNHGKMARDFTYIDDITNGIVAALEHPPGQRETWHQLFNLGNDQPEQLMTLVETLEQKLGITAIKHMRDMQKGDVTQTWADISRAREILGYKPAIGLDEGLSRYVDWRKGLASGF